MKILNPEKHKRQTSLSSFRSKISGRRSAGEKWEAKALMYEKRARAEEVWN